MKKMFSKLVKILFLHGFTEILFKKSNDIIDYYTWKDVELTSKDNLKLFSLLIEPSSVDDETEIFVICHGVREDRWRAAKHVNLLKLKDKNALFVVVDYRSFGGSQGEFSISNVNEDLNIVVTHLQEKYKSKKIHFIGHSLGCGIVLEYCRSMEKEGKASIIGEIFCFAPFTTLLDVAKDKWFLKPFGFIIKLIIPKDINYDNIKNVSFLESNLHIFHGKKDELIHFKHSITLHNKSKLSTKLIITDEHTHNSVFGCIDHWKYIFDELNKRK